MPDEKEKTIEATEKVKQPDHPSLEIEEDLSELDLEGISGASCVNSDIQITRSRVR